MLIYQCSDYTRSVGKMGMKLKLAWNKYKRLKFDSPKEEMKLLF